MQQGSELIIVPWGQGSVYCFTTRTTKYSAAQYEAECLQKDLQRSQSEVADLQRSLEAAQLEIFDLKCTAYGSGGNNEELRALQAESAATIEELRQENRNARRRVAEVEAEFRLLKESQNTSLTPLIQEDFKKQLSEWKRRLGLRSSAELDEVFNGINDRLDRALTYEVRTNEADFAQQELKNQLRESHNSASELANRVEALLAEKEALKREAGLWNTEKLDLMATRGLLEQRVTALERQLEEVREKLVAETAATRQVRMESQQFLLERNSQTVQFNALVESLAATLSIVESPCAPTEATVKERVTRLTTELQSLKKVESDLEKKVEHLNKQFEFQFTNGQALADELNTLKCELEGAHKAKERLQCELDGFRLINSQKQLTQQNLGKVVELCDKLHIQVGQHSHSALIELIASKVADLLDNGCISPDCIQRSTVSKSHPKHLCIETRSTQHNCIQKHKFKNGNNDCPSCVHLQTTPLDLANRAPDWSDLEVRRVQHLCAECLLCLAMALRHRLHAVMTVAPDREKLEKELVGELEKAKREMEEMHERVMKMENEKSEEYEKLEQIVSKLEALRQHQAKRIAGLQSKTQRQSTLEAQKDQQLSAAKNFLIENRQKQLRKHPGPNSWSGCLAHAQPRGFDNSTCSADSVERLSSKQNAVSNTTVCSILVATADICRSTTSRLTRTKP
ncbi:Kinectin (Kinesin receptor) (CG-1 antigen) [Echinococcus granulosus]|uniref:Kinectin (Kinesin receptor) (CG-1 antigen) n=1 Tax=Echinococcus granulosus TaxID=6210 RepID=W6U5Y5_ECHGR|nr:Kinectin (Kinesin receptor) (CG-1 antigen) [Echinococcus granulosus]EUB56520.1 Kinectin (Kinesin receptor) (CG-1 antigen) [Echinococcus granulosus]